MKTAIFTPDIFLSLGSCEAKQVARISFDGVKYTYEVKYYIYDYYDWDGTQDVKISAVSDKEMYQLCRVGAGKFYQNWGKYEVNGEIVFDSNRGLAEQINDKVRKHAAVFKYMGRVIL